MVLIQGSIILINYQNRKILLDDKVFKFHTSAKYADRIQYLDAIKDIVNNPDEVWINNYSGTYFDNLVMIKFYNDTAIAVVSKVEDGMVRVKTWFKIALESTEKVKAKNPRWAYRRGLLIYNKR